LAIKIIQYTTLQIAVGLKCDKWAPLLKNLAGLLEGFVGWIVYETHQITRCIWKTTPWGLLWGLQWISFQAQI